MKEHLPLREEIIAFWDKLNSLSGDQISWAYKPVPDFIDKHNYPMDFQIFMEEIKWIERRN